MNDAGPGPDGPPGPSGGDDAGSRGVGRTGPASIGPPPGGVGRSSVVPGRLGLLRRLRSRGAARGAFQTFVGGNEVTLLRDGAQAFPAMLDAIAAAEREVLVEMYWFASDATGRRFAAALAARARTGCRVCVVFDAVGSWETDNRLFEDLADAGCEVVEYAPIAPWRKRFRLGAVNNRDHRKIVVVDGVWGITGGVNLADEWAPEVEGGGGWRDDMLAVAGPAASELRDLFFRTFVELGGTGPTSASPERRGGAGPAAEAADDGDAVPEVGAVPVRVHAGDYRDERLDIRRAYLARLEAARERVYVANAYFVPDGAIGRALVAAAGRGVDVQVLVPGDNDVPAVDWASRFLYDRLLRGGIRIHRYAGPILHAKTAVVDGRWCSVGTFNLDHRSWRFNLEVTVEVEDPGLGGEMERRFRHDLARSRSVSLAGRRFRPLGDRLLEALFFSVRRLL